MMGEWDSFYRDRIVLVTGHTGFKGGWLVSWLKMLGARVVGFSLPPKSGRPSLFEAADVGRDMVSVLGDIRDFQVLADVFRTHSPEVVFHLAAQPLVRRSYREPVDTYAINVMGTVHLLEAVRQTPSVRAVVVVTSDKCYENKEWVWGYRENEPMGGRDPYSSSKGCAELVTSAYRESFLRGSDRVAIASARAGNVIGGGDWAEDRLVPDIIRALSDNKPVILRNPEATRPWQHVLEPLRGYLMLGVRLYAEGGPFAEAWNFGPRDGDAISVRELAEKAVGLWGGGKISAVQNVGAYPEACFLKLDCSKAQIRLGWRPVLGIDEALQMTISWYRAYLEDPKSVSQCLVVQIRTYMERSFR